MDHRNAVICLLCIAALLPALEARPLPLSTIEISIFCFDAVMLLLLYLGCLFFCYVYFTKDIFSLKDKPMTVLKRRSCRRWFKLVNKVGVRDIRLEFTHSVKHYNPNLSTNAFDDDENQFKNRYDDVALYDKTRVKIKINPENDDYIHASFVKIFHGLTYICTQGPLPNTVHQFWLMCLQEDVKVILQLCQNIEENEEKCTDYLPTSTKWTSFGPVKVKIEDVPASTIDKLTKTIVRCKFGDKESTITHLLYAGWPDRAPPESVSACVEIRKLVRRLCKRKPIVVHCSAGIGRSGTFVAIEMATSKILNEIKPSFEMADLVKELRGKRRQAVQNNIQYIFIYRCVIEILLSNKGLKKTDEVAAFIEEYDNVVARKLMPKKRTSTKSTSKLDGSDKDKIVIQ